MFKKTVTHYEILFFLKWGFKDLNEKQTEVNSTELTWKSYKDIFEYDIFEVFETDGRTVWVRERERERQSDKKCEMERGRWRETMTERWVTAASFVTPKNFRWIESVESIVLHCGPLCGIFAARLRFSLHQCGLKCKRLISKLNYTSLS